MTAPRAQNQGLNPDVDTVDEWWETPAHVVTLMECSEGRYGNYVLLDTERGAVSVINYMDGRESFEGYKNYALVSFRNELSRPGEDFGCQT